MRKQESRRLPQILKSLHDTKKVIASISLLMIALTGCSLQEVGNVAGKAAESLFVIAIAVIFFYEMHSNGW